MGPICFMEKPDIFNVVCSSVHQGAKTAVQKNTFYIIKAYKYSCPVENTLTYNEVTLGTKHKNLQTCGKRNRYRRTQFLL